jgi:hypothetical protein
MLWLILSFISVGIHIAGDRLIFWKRLRGWGCSTFLRIDSEFGRQAAGGDMKVKAMLVGAALASTALLGAPQARANVVTFDDSVGNTLAGHFFNSFTDQRLPFTNSSPISGLLYVIPDFWLVDAGLPSDGTNVLSYGLGTAPMVITKAGGGDFDLFSADFALSANSFGAPSDTVQLTAATAGGPVTRTITLGESFQTYSLNLINVSSIEITPLHLNDNYSYWAADNFVTNNVPEPATWAMILMGFGMMGVAFRALDLQNRRLARLQLTPREFTPSQLQPTVEAVAGVSLHKQDFRGGLERAGRSGALGRLRAETRGRPAELFRFRRELVRAAAPLGWGCLCCGSEGKGRIGARLSPPDFAQKYQAKSVLDDEGIGGRRKQMISLPVERRGSGGMRISVRDPFETLSAAMIATRKASGWARRTYKLNVH